jgi:hypothetical protein
MAFKVASAVRHRRLRNESAPDPVESRTLVRTALPRKLLITTLRSDLHLHNDPFVMPLLLPLCWLWDRLRISRNLCLRRTGMAKWLDELAEHETKADRLHS